MSNKQKIKKAIVEYFGFRANGFQFYGHQLANYAKGVTGCKHTYTDTVLRYMRELRDERKVFFDCLQNSKSLYKIVK